MFIIGHNQTKPEEPVMISAVNIGDKRIVFITDLAVNAIFHSDANEAYDMTNYSRLQSYLAFDTDQYATCWEDVVSLAAVTEGYAIGSMCRIV